MAWQELVDALHSVVTSPDCGMGRVATYTDPCGVQETVCGVFDEPHVEVDADLRNMTSSVSTCNPTFGVQLCQFLVEQPKQGGTLEIDEVPGIVYVIADIEPMEVGWAKLELVEK